MRIQRHHTQRAAVGATEAELNRRAISTTRTDHNQSGVDLVAILADKSITIEVKGQQGENSDWFISKHRRADTVFVLVFVPTLDLEQPGIFRFFIMTCADIDEAMQRYLQDRRNRGTSDDKWVPAIRWRDAVPYENCWNKIC